MNSLFLYIIKVLVCSGILFLYYWLALRNKKFHQYNRFYILFSVVCSLLIPLMHLSWFTVKENTVNNYRIVRVLYEGELDPIVVTNQKINWGTIGLYSIVGISAILLLLLAVRVFNVFRLARKYPLVKWEGVDFLDTDISAAPFSFLNYLFWKNNIDLQSNVGQQILEHELTHIRQKHTWDKLFMQIVSALMWFNPFYWLMQRELSMIHEFLADEKAIGNQDIQSFATMLLEAHFGKQILSPVNPFAYRPIRRRLKMLTSSSNPKYSYMRRLFFLPLLVVVTGLFAFTVKKQDWQIPQININDWINSVGINFHTHDTSTINKQTLPKPDSLIIIRDNKKRDTLADVESEKMAIVNSGIFRDESQKETNLTLLEDVPLKGNVSGVFVRGHKLDTESQPLYVLDGVPMDDVSSPLNAVNPDNIERIDVLKDKAAESIYGARAKDGVVLITTKKGHVGTLKDKDTSFIVVRGYKKPQKQDDEENLNEVTVVGFGQQYKKPKQKVDKEASFPGGVQAWKTYLMRNLRADVPTSNGAPAGKNGKLKNYTVVVSFIIDKNGNLSDIRAENSPGYGTAEEAVRVIGGSGKWIPAEQNGKKVAYRQRQQITFQITEK